MDPSWEFQAPQFVDFNRIEDQSNDEEEKKVDEFFNVDMESGELWTTALEDQTGSAGAGAQSQEDKLGTGDPSYGVKEDKYSSTADTTVILSSSSGGMKGKDQLASSSTECESSKVPDRPSFLKSSLFPKNRRPPNLVTSWGNGIVNKMTVGSSKGESSSTSSASKYKQPLKKRRRLSSAIVKAFSSPSRSNNNSATKLVLKMTPRRVTGGSIAGYKASGGTPKRLGTNSAEPRLAINMWKKRKLDMEESSRPKSAPAAGGGSKFFGTVPKPFKLSTEARAEERKVLDVRRKEEEQHKEQLRSKEMERRRREKEKELLKYRSTLIHKAQPIKQYRKIEIKRSDKMLTLPESPHLTSAKYRPKLTSI